MEEIAQAITHDYKDESFVIVSILKGACILTADLQRVLYTLQCRQFRTSFVSIRTYRSGTESSRNPQLIQDVDFDPKDEQILLVDDIIDTGISLRFLHHIMTERGAKSVRSFAFLSKPERREVDYEANYVGFSVPNVWVEGYGMDSDEYGRGNPNIIVGPSICLGCER